MHNSQKIIVHSDGGARGNPGKAAIGVEIKAENGVVLGTISKTIGIDTNNGAEYKAVIAAFEWLIKRKTNIPHETCVDFYLDSELVARQLSGLYKVKHPMMRKYLQNVRLLEQELDMPVTYIAIRREQNKDADALVNAALDAQQ